MTSAHLGQAIVDALLLSSPDGRRYLQNSPILPDVWLHYADEPGVRLDLLITPHSLCPAGTVAVDLARAMPPTKADRHIAHLRGFAVAKLTFDELLNYVMPRTGWWRDMLHTVLADTQAKHPENIVETLSALIEAQLRFASVSAGEVSRTTGAQDSPALDRERTTLRALSANNPESLVRFARFLALCGTVAANRAEFDSKTLGALLKKIGIKTIVGEAMRRYHELVTLRRDDAAAAPLIYNVSLNRRAATALDKSVPAIKGDAARTLFNISAASIGWAVLDTGIDATHEAFFDHTASLPDEAGKSRVVASFDFTRVRDLLRAEYLFDDTGRKSAARKIARERGLKADKVEDALLRLARGAEHGAQIDWSTIAPLIAIENDTPVHPHGTHVAGIIGADWRAAQGAPVDTRKMVGVCPDIKLYDLRVIGGNAEETEYAVIAALQYVAALNEIYMRIHGVNMSLSIPHNVRNYACGRTPVCDESTNLIATGVVVVAAAGNRGYQQFQLASGDVFESYSSSSITDPGNAEGVITVGATHRYWPHTYGVSFFSSRGPTGDGRAKPDIVAPGEKIESTVPGNSSEAMDGTSMAAPHVSGAAALLLARYSELIRQPAEVKRMLCKNATDLQRERSFQGAGMLDVLRALQNR